MHFVVLLCLIGSCQALVTLTSPVDLGYKFDSDTVYWIGYGNFNLTNLAKQESPFWFTTNSYSAAEHGGTHLDAPYHFNKAGWRVGDIPLERLLVQGVVLDLKKEAAQNPDFEVTPDHLITWERTYGPLPQSAVILANFGWAWKYSNKTAYYGGTNTSNLHFPGFSKDAATWIVKTGKVVGVGVDTPSIDPGADTTFKAHQVLNGANIYCLENVALSNVSLPARDFQLSVMPMKIAEGSGAPLRLIAYPYNSSQSFYRKIVSWISSIFGGNFHIYFN